MSVDPEDPEAYLGRARAFLALGQWDQALADLERAGAWAGGRPWLLSRITLAYARCLPGRPDRLPRVLALGRRTLDAAIPLALRAAFDGALGLPSSRQPTADSEIARRPGR